MIATLLESALLWRLAIVEQASRVFIRSAVLLVLLAEAGYVWLMWEHLSAYPRALRAAVALLLMVAIFIRGPQPRFRAVA